MRIDNLALLLSGDIIDIIIKLVALLRSEFVNVKLNYAILTWLKILNDFETASERCRRQSSESFWKIILFLIWPRLV